ncbi:MAG: diacylglycerol/lipid kinase family protein [Solirubrobacterales bacterium]
MRTRQLEAVAAIGFFAAAVCLTVIVFARHFWVGLAVLVCLLLAIGAAWYGVRRRGAALVAGLAAAAGLLAGSLVIAAGSGLLLVGAAWILAVAASIALARAAFLVHVSLPAATPPRRAVLFFNPKSGGGKAERFNLAAEAPARGIEAVELKRGDDLAALVAGAIERGADALAMAGGDGSQAIVAAAAAEHGLPYACIPAGTRNHFALDLGVDRDDVVGALDAFVDGGERRVDLAEVNGRVFVNNVSLGLYAEAVQREGYREAKLRTILDTMPDVLGPGGEGLGLRWRGPSGRAGDSGAVVLVSNNRYRLGRPLGSGTRPKIDEGKLGIAVMSAPAGPQKQGLFPRSPWEEWSASTFEVEADARVPAGIDGEAVQLEPPLRFSIHPLALRVRIARSHPGASPSATVPDRPAQVVAALLRIAAGRSPRRTQP